MFKAFIDRFRFREPYLEEPQVMNSAQDQHWDLEVDVAIAGFGGAGASAALECHAQNLDVLVFDRFAGGGATTLSGGVFYAGGGTRIQKACDMDDDAGNMFRYLKQEVQGAVSDNTLKQFCDQSVENFDWLEEQGVPFDASFCEFKTSYPPNHLFYYYSGNESFKPYSDTATPAARGHRAHRKGISGAAIFEPLRQSVLEKSIKVKTQTKLVALLIEDQRHAEGENQSKVVGVKVLEFIKGSKAALFHGLLSQLQIHLRHMSLFWPPLFNLLAAASEKLELNYAQTQFIKANKGVMLATGGFFSNQTMVKEFAPDYVGGSPLGTMADDGSGIKLAQALGGKTDLLDRVSAWRFINPPSSFAKGVLMGPSGKRICNEMLYGAQVGDLMMKEHEGKAYVILDSVLYKQAFKDLTLDKALWFHVLQGWFFLFLGIKKSNTLEGLAKQLNIDPVTFNETVRNYNAVAKSDAEDVMGKPKDYMSALGQAPFYAVDASYDYLYCPCPSLTLGGLKVNESSGLVLNSQSEDIAGLYAIGRTAVGIPSKGYVSGLSIADCVFSGRRAARHVSTIK